MMMERAARGFGILAAVLLLACGGSKKGDKIPTGDHTSRPGMGDSTARPTGDAFALPAGIRVDGGFEAYDYDLESPCWESDVTVGDGNLVNLCFALENTTGSTITVRLPPGLIFISKSLDYQNGIILQETEIEVPGGEIVVVLLGSHCLNLGRHVPEQGKGYELGPITRDEQLHEIAELIEGKTLDIVGMLSVQYAVWDVTDGDGLTDEIRAELAAL